MPRCRCLARGLRTRRGRSGGLSGSAADVKDAGVWIDSSRLEQSCLAAVQLGVVLRLSVDSLGQGNDEPFRAAHVSHPPCLLVLADAPDQSVAVSGELAERRVEIIDLESHVA